MCDTPWDALLFSFKVIMIAGTWVKMLQQTKRCQDGSEEIHGAVVTSFDVGHPAEMADVESMSSRGGSCLDFPRPIQVEFLALGNYARIGKSRSRHQIP